MEALAPHPVAIELRHRAWAKPDRIEATLAWRGRRAGEIGARATQLAEEAEEVHLAFNDNRGADAPVAARRMRELLGQDPGPEPE